MPPSAMIGNVALGRRARARRDRRDHRHADAGDDARRADRSGADADLHRVDAAVDERDRGVGRGDVAGDEIDVRVALAYPSPPCRARPANGRAPCRSRARPRWPCTSASARSTVSLLTPIAAPTRRRPSESLQAFGYLTTFCRSLTVIRPLSRNAESTTSSFSTLWRWNISRAWSSVVPTGHRDEILLRHDLGDRPIDARLEAQVAIGQDADEPAFLAAVLGDRHAADAVLLHQVERFDRCDAAARA